jgi:hypothetical protein
MASIQERQTELGEDIERIIALQREEMILGHGWLSLVPIWRQLIEMGEARDADKRGYRSTKPWSKESSHFTGLLGEAAFSFLTGLPLNANLIAAGDGGWDYATAEGLHLDVKTSLFWRDPWLKQYPSPKRWVDYYILVAADTTEGRVRVVGHATQDEVKNAALVDWGHGKQRSLPWNVLHAGLPAEVPPRAQLAEGTPAREMECKT